MHPPSGHASMHSSACIRAVFAANIQAKQSPMTHVASSQERRAPKMKMASYGNSPAVQHPGVNHIVPSLKRGTERLKSSQKRRVWMHVGAFLNTPEIISTRTRSLRLMVSSWRRLTRVFWRRGAPSSRECSAVKLSRP
jgi:hypothetical protein